MRVIDLRTGKRRRFAIAREPRVIAAAGRYFAYATGRRDTIVVHSLDTGREVYRVMTGGYQTYRLAPGGRLVVLPAGSHDDPGGDARQARNCACCAGSAWEVTTSPSARTAC